MIDSYIGKYQRFNIPPIKSYIVLPEELYIWGVNEYSAIALFVLEAMHVKVLGFIDSYYETNYFHNKRVFKPENLHEGIHYHIMLIPHSENSELKFEYLCQFLSNHFNQLKLTIIHPATLCFVAPQKFSRKLLINGMPGCGNAILSHIAIAISTDIKTIKNLQEKAWEIWAHDFARITVSTWNNSMAAIGLQNGVYNYAKYLDGSHPHFTNDKKLIRIDRLPLPLHYLSDALGGHYHQYQTLSFEYELSNCFQFVALRHPLDYLLSRAHKIIPVDLLLNTMNDSSGKTDFSANLAKRRLNNPNWICQMLDEFSDYYTVALREKKMLLIKYEEIQSNFELTCKQIAEFMRINDISPTQIQKYAMELLNKPLFNHMKNHFNEPGIEKWKSYRFPVSIKSEINRLSELCALTNYEFDKNLLRFDEKNSSSYESQDSYVSAEELKLATKVIIINNIPFLLSSNCEELLSKTAETIQGDKNILNTLAWLSIPSSA